MTRWAIVADLNRCVGCQTCTAACKHANNTAPDVQWRKVLDFETGEFPDVRRAFVPVGCMHCEEPSCMDVCPSTATFKREDGIVGINYDICLGCAYCAVACPYQARFRVDEPAAAFGKNLRMRHETKREDPARLSVAQKCTLCVDRIDEGLAAADKVMVLTDGTLAAFRSSYDPTWGTLKAITRPIPGNHEYHTDGAAGYVAYWDDPPGWYAWDAGAWRIYMLDSTCGETDCRSEQAWLERDLQDNPARCTAIAMHYPRFSSGAEHGSNPTMNRFWKIAYAEGVDLALAGHEHTYERFAAMDPDGRPDPARGIVSFVSGVGGKSLYGLDPRVPGSEFAQNSAFGVLLLTLMPRSFRWRFVDIDGATLDRGSARCH